MRAAIALLLFLASDLFAQAHPELPERPVWCETLVRFSPKGGAADLLVAQIESADRRIAIAIYGLNNPAIVDALIAAKRRGVEVAVKLDKLQSAGKNQKAQIERLKRSGIRAEVSELSRLLHNKFAVIDRRVVITGSYNWTVQAEHRHRENLVLLVCPSIAEVYEKEWALIESGRRAG